MMKNVMDEADGETDERLVLLEGVTFGGLERVGERLEQLEDHKCTDELNALLERLEGRVTRLETIANHRDNRHASLIEGANLERQMVILLNDLPSEVS